jgi:hypothetical protein
VEGSKRPVGRDVDTGLARVLGVRLYMPMTVPLSSAEGSFGAGISLRNRSSERGAYFTSMCLLRRCSQMYTVKRGRLRTATVSNELRLLPAIGEGRDRHFRA